MVAASDSSQIPNARTQALEDQQIPIIDLSIKDSNRSEILKLILNACEDVGFFKVINHGVPSDVIGCVEQKSFAFFGKPVALKQQADRTGPIGYGCKNIGRCGDKGEIEYLLLRADPQDISYMSKTISDDPGCFSTSMNDYIAAVRELASNLLDMIAESLGLDTTDTSVFNKLITDPESDSLIRLNHYPVTKKDGNNSSSKWIGFGEHTDPQILTLLRSNDVGGLQICKRDGVWVPVNLDPAAFCVNVGDTLQALTNGRLRSARHRVMMNSSDQSKSRLSVIYFTSPPPNALITCLPEFVSQERPPLYRPFTWAEMKKVMYEMKLAENRLDYFRVHL